MRSCVPACSTRLGVAAMPNRAARRPPVSKKKGRLVAAHQVERPAGEQHDFRRAFMRQRPGDFGLAPAVDEQQVTGEH